MSPRRSFGCAVPVLGEGGERDPGIPAERRATPAHKSAALASEFVIFAGEVEKQSCRLRVLLPGRV